MVHWKPQDSEDKIELLPLARTFVIHRPFDLGALVCNPTDRSIFGNVVEIKASFDLVATMSHPPHNHFPALSKLAANPSSMGRWLLRDSSLPQYWRAVPGRALAPVVDFHPDDLIIHQNWLGLVGSKVEYTPNLLLANGALVRPARSDKIVCHFFDVGEIAFTTQDNLQSGTWLAGSFDPSVEPVGLMVSMSAEVLPVRWIASRPDPPVDSGATEAPPEILRPFDLPHVVKFDPTGRPIKDPHSIFTRTVDRDVFVGEHVAICPTFRDPRFRDLEGSRAIFCAMPDSIDCTVLWHDGTTSQHKNILLDPVVELPDVSELRPGSIVVPTYIEQPSDVDVWAPDKVGVVQRVSPADGIAHVIWTHDTHFQFTINKDTGKLDGMLGDSLSGLPLKTTDVSAQEEVSAYDIMLLPVWRECALDDVVMIFYHKLGAVASCHRILDHAPCICSACQLAAKPQDATVNWVGRVIALELNGMITVRLDGLQEPEIHSLPPECVELAFRHSDDDPSEDEMNGHGYGGDSESDMSLDPGSDAPIETWYENENGDRIEVDPTADDDGWATADDDADHADQADEADGAAHDSDTSMPDAPAEPIHAALSVPMAVQAGVGQAPPAYLMLDTMPPEDHHYRNENSNFNWSPRQMKKIGKDHSILAEAGSLPDGVFVRSWESRIDMFRVLMIGPEGTPYEHAPFVMDFILPSTYPDDPPQAHFHSWTYGQGRVNPNLYEEGKICLSLLNT